MWPFLDAWKVRYVKSVWSRVLRDVDPNVVGRLVADWNAAEHKGNPPRPGDILAMAGAFSPPPAPLADMEGAAGVWADASRLLRSACDEATFDLWIAPLEPLGFDADVLVLGAPATIRGWVDSRLRKAIQGAVGCPVEFRAVAA